MRARTGFAHAGYAALHVREMLSHGDSDPLQKTSVCVRAMHCCSRADDGAYTPYKPH